MKKLLILFALMLVTFTANAQSYIYDVNFDGVINISDISCLVNRRKHLIIKLRTFDKISKPYTGSDFRSISFPQNAVDLISRRHYSSFNSFKLLIYPFKLIIKTLPSVISDKSYLSAHRSKPDISIILAQN